MGSTAQGVVCGVMGVCCTWLFSELNTQKNPSWLFEAEPEGWPKGWLLQPSAENAGGLVQQREVGDAGGLWCARNSGSRCTYVRARTTL